MDDRRKTIGKKVQAARRRANFRSAKAFADMLGYHENSVANFERGSARAGSGFHNAVEDWIGWPQGSIAAYIAGTGPEPWDEDAGFTTPSGDNPDRADALFDSEPVHEWSAETRRRMVSMSMQEVVQRLREEAEFHGEEAAEWLMREITRVREESRPSQVGIDAQRP